MDIAVLLSAQGRWWGFSSRFPHSSRSWPSCHVVCTKFPNRVINAASTSIWRYPLILLIFIMAPKRYQPKREEEGEHSESRVGAGYGKEWEADQTGEQRAATRAPTPLYSRPR